MNSKITFLLILILSVCGAAVTGWNLLAAVKEYREGETIYESVAAAARAAVPADPVIPEDPVFTETAFFEDDGAAVQLPEGKPSSVDFGSLMLITPDIKGWIRLEGTKVDYPVVQSRDNDYYLNRAVNGEWNKVGTPFIDFRNSGNFSDRLTVIYGHYMGDGSMFTPFHEYKNQKFYEEHPFIELFTPGENYRILPVAGVFQNVEYWDFTFDFFSDEDFLRQIDFWKALSTFHSDTEYDADDRFVVLTLCTYDIENGRFLLVGKLEPVKY